MAAPRPPPNTPPMIAPVAPPTIAPPTGSCAAASCIGIAVAMASKAEIPTARIIPITPSLNSSIEMRPNRGEEYGSVGVCRDLKRLAAQLHHCNSGKDSTADPCSGFTACRIGDYHFTVPRIGTSSFMAPSRPPNLRALLCSRRSRPMVFSAGRPTIPDRRGKTSTSNGCCLLAQPRQGPRSVRCFREPPEGALGDPTGDSGPGSVARVGGLAPPDAGIARTQAASVPRCRLLFFQLAARSAMTSDRCASENGF